MFGTVTSNSPLSHDAFYCRSQDDPAFGSDDVPPVAPDDATGAKGRPGRKEGHTISQRLRKLKQIPAELIPLAVVVGFAIFAAGYSTIRKFYVDKNLRLSRQGPASRADH
ncbi:hypothetical protein RJ55_00155 [Drechmeria coniospora]|nr:hypothetical protein RJ55_00155 [Drechmeria coniospora]